MGLSGVYTLVSEFTNLAELYTKHLKKDRICILKTAHVEFSQLVPEDAQENIVLTMHEVVGKK